MRCSEAGRWIHEYLDGDLEAQAQAQLNRHLHECPDCRERLDRLEQTEALLHLVRVPEPSDGLTERVMLALPRARRRDAVMQWARRHPAASVAAAFVLVMFASVLSLWNGETDLIVRGADLDGIVIQGNTVIVPSGYVVAGDLLVENGQLQIDGQVNGNVTVVDGSWNAASTALIAGQVKSVSEPIDYFWYRIKKIFSGFSREKDS